MLGLFKELVCERKLTGGHEWQMQSSLRTMHKLKKKQHPAVLPVILALHHSNSSSILIHCAPFKTSTSLKINSVISLSLCHLPFLVPPSYNLFLADPLVTLIPFLCPSPSSCLLVHLPSASQTASSTSAGGTGLFAPVRWRSKSE